MKKWIYAAMTVGIGGIATPSWATFNITPLKTASNADIYYLQAPTIPMVSVKAIFPKAGQMADLQYGWGVADMTSSLMKYGIKKGQQTLDEHQIADQLADNGASIAAESTRDHAVFSITSLTEPKYLKNTINLASDILGFANFPAKVIERERKNTIAGIKDSLTKPEVLANNALRKTLYGNHPYGYTLTVADVKKLNRQHMLTFHQCQYQKPYFIVVGAVSEQLAIDMATQLEQSTPKTTVRCPSERSMAMPPPAKATRVALYHPTASQTDMTVATTIGKRDEKDFFPLLLGQYLLGGSGFGSLLMSELREKRGLTYGVYSSIQYSDQNGSFVISNQTRNEKALEAEALTHRVLADFVRQGPDPAKLEEAKNALIKGFPMRFDSTSSLIAQVYSIVTQKLPLNYLDKWVDQVKAVTAQEVQRAMAGRIALNRLVTVVVSSDRHVLKPSRAVTP